MSKPHIALNAGEGPEPSPLAAAMREVDFQRNRANDAERLWKADCESWDKDRALLTEAVKALEEIAQAKMPGQARSIAHATLSKIKAEAAGQ